MTPKALDRENRESIVAEDLSAASRRIVAILEKNPKFRRAFLSPPQRGPEGETILDLGFGAEPPILRVSAPTPTLAYARLYELACRLMESWQNPSAAGEQRDALTSQA